jgi:8-oxo-dGTP pyrophosphatase MutT (NUDIX family)
MKWERSYGAVCYKKEDGAILFLIEKMGLGHYSLPKGHIEEGETPSSCALREIKEETGLEVELDTSFSSDIVYSPKKGIEKKVTFFLAKIVGGELKAQKEEVDSIYFLDYIKARDILTYSSDKKVLDEANNRLLIGEV